MLFGGEQGAKGWLCYSIMALQVSRPGLLLPGRGR